MYCILVNSFKDKNIYISTLWSNSKISEKNNNNNNLFLVFLAVLRFLRTGFNVNISNIRISFHQKHLVKNEGALHLPHRLYHLIHIFDNYATEIDD